MHSNIAAGFLSPSATRRAKSIIGSCVHCGMCTAVCPTYLLDADERDSPRGRIYLINEMLVRGKPSAVALRHLDSCLTCRACETACPSGVQYGELADLGRNAAEPARSFGARQKRALAAAIFGAPWLMNLLGAAGALVQFALPAGLRQHFARRRQVVPQRRQRNVLMLHGCVEGALSPQTHAALSVSLAAADIGIIAAPQAGCCGALRYHLNQQEEGLADMRRNVTAWAKLLESGEAEWVVMTSSGCHQMVAEYARLLGTPEAKLVAERTLNIVELAEREIVPRLRCNNIGGIDDHEKEDNIVAGGVRKTVVYHSPCTMQHGLKMDGRVEAVLAAAGYQVLTPAEKGVCCGSAGAYSLMQPQTARRLRARKLQNMQAAQAGATVQYATANIGCQLFLSGGGQRPVVHWLELLADALGDENTISGEDAKSH